MKKILLKLALLGFAFVPVLALAGGGNPPLTYVAVATFTATSGANVVAFQNTSADLDVRVLKIEVSNAHDVSANTGGLVQYWVFGSTAVVHGGTGQTRSFSLSSTNAGQPSYITISTGAVSPSLENLSGGSSLPLIRPLVVNTDDGASSNLTDSYTDLGPASSAASDSSPLILPHGSNRALIVQQHDLGGGAINTGKMRASFIYTVR